MNGAYEYGSHEMRNAKILDGKHEEKRELQRLGHRWEDNIKINCKEI
jgi:hypothetical protein